jgi:hypothetical protein
LEPPNPSPSTVMGGWTSPNTMLALGVGGGCENTAGKETGFRELPNPCRPEYIGKVFKSRCMFGQFDRQII